ncbi:MAG: fibronectin type III domain-containing protein [Gammaproteobacteria bacterium]|nr:fibronectin type III domain-containing protein [Gammaproteobacteria bacterium]MBV8308194.1 fibronectin type III domain-containing protein [Gammaproteobacteria bacterium]MBV8405727.1 fibronectin type III domain-containing protein [Gammaproteobacteria bacterium]
MADSILRAAALAGVAACYVPLTAWSQTGDSLSIAGVPPTTVQAGQTYTFTPQAVASGPVIPHFEVQNPPPWASLGWSGQLSGIPAATDEGTYPDIVISIVAGTTRASLPAFSITVQGASPSATATISWSPPTTNDDGSVLTNLMGYRIYVGSTPTTLAPLLTLDSTAMTSYLLQGLRTGLSYFAMTAVNSAGVESQLSEVVAVTLY